MPAKSRRNRRNISQGPKTTVNRSVASPAGMTPAMDARPEKTVNTYNNSPRTAATTAAATINDTTSFVFGEIKWISLVTAIVAVILVILYIFLH
jgi:hypothetical protein